MRQRRTAGDPWVQQLGLLRLADILAAIEEQMTDEHGQCEYEFTRYHDARGEPAYRFRVRSGQGEFESVSQSKEAAAQRCLMLMLPEESSWTSQ